MSANLVVDLNAGVLEAVSIAPASGNGGGLPASGAIIGNPVDMITAGTFTNVLIAAGQSQSGALRVAVQTSDSTISGTFTDPTSGLAQLPTWFQSGGLIYINSGGANLASGNFYVAGFQNPNRYARAIILSGDFYNGPTSVGFINNYKVTGSGGGYTLSPSSGAVNV